jgi:hypothetical protein
LAYRGKSKGSYGSQKHGRSSWRGSGKAKHDADLAVKSFESRSKRSQCQDLRMSAPIAKNITVYLKSPGELDWLGVDNPGTLSKLARKGSQIEINDSKAKKKHRFKVVKKTEKKPEKQELKSEANNPTKEESSHKLPTEKEIYDRAVRMYQEENFSPRHGDSAPEVNPTKGELSEEGWLQKAKLDLMTKTDTKASRDVMDYVDNIRQELEKIGFTVEPMQGFDVSDLKY